MRWTASRCSGRLSPGSVGASARQDRHAGSVWSGSVSRSPVKIASRVACRSRPTCGRVKRSGPGAVGVMVIPTGASGSATGPGGRRGPDRAPSSRPGRAASPTGPATGSTACRGGAARSCDYHLRWWTVAPADTGQTGATVVLVRYRSAQPGVRGALHQESIGLHLSCLRSNSNTRDI